MIKPVIQVDGTVYVRGRDGREVFWKNTRFRSRFTTDPANAASIWYYTPFLFSLIATTVSFLAFFLSFAAMGAL